MSTVDDLRLPQTHETAALVIAGESFHLQVAYARSADSRASDDLGQDYLSVRQDGDRLAFVLCDGVSQSFVGDLAARVLGEAMLHWLWQLDAETIQAQVLQEACHQYLQELSPTVAPQVTNYSLPGDLPPMLREVLERKRELGSESTLSAGLLDVAADKLLLVWLGDSRIRLWDRQGECTADLGDTFLTPERWSTHRGPIGRVHVFTTNLKDIKRVVAYSDGLAVMDRGLNDSLTMRSLDAVIAEAGDAPTSDDISFLEVRFSPFVEAEGEPRPFLTMAEAIRLTSSKPQPLEVETPAAEAPAATQLVETSTLPSAPQTLLGVTAVAPPPPPLPQPASSPPAPVSVHSPTPTFAPRPPLSRAKPTRRFDQISRVSLGVISVVVVLCLALAGVLVLGLLPGRKAQETPVSTSIPAPTVTATEILVTYVVTPQVEGVGGAIQPSDPQTIKAGESVTFGFVPDEGYEVAQVLINGQAVGKPDQYTIPSISMPQKVVVRFASKTYIIRLKTEGAGGTIVREGPDANVRPSFRVAYDQSAKLLIRPDAGYAIDWLKINGNDVDRTSLKSVDGQQEIWSYEIPNVCNPYSVWVKFELEEYTIEATAVPEAGGIISPTGIVTVTHGSTRTFAITPNDGYMIAAVLVDEENIGSVSTYTFPPVAADCTIKAQFELRTYTVKVVVEGLPAEMVKAAVSPGPDSPQNVRHGDSVRLVVTLPEDYRVSEMWFGDQQQQDWLGKIAELLSGPITFVSPSVVGDTTIRIVFQSVGQ